MNCESDASISVENYPFSLSPFFVGSKFFTWEITFYEGNSILSLSVLVGGQFKTPNLCMHNFLKSLSRLRNILATQSISKPL